MFIYLLKKEMFLECAVVVELVYQLVEKSSKSESTAKVPIKLFLYIITPHVNGEPLLKRSSSYSILSQFATILLVVWFAYSDGYPVVLLLPR